MHARRRNDGELRHVERIRTFAKNRALRSLLATSTQEGGDILDTRLHRAAQGLAFLEVVTVAREHVTDLALRNGHQVDPVHAILERNEVVQTTTQQGRLVAHLTIEGDQSTTDRRRAP